MKIISALFVISLLFGCSKPPSNVTSESLTESSEKRESAPSNGRLDSTHDSEYARRTLQLSGHSFDVVFEDSKVKLVELPNEINETLKIRFFERMLAIYDVDRLKRVCGEMNYKNQKSQVLTRIRASLVLNPFSEEAIKHVVNREATVKPQPAIPGALKVISAETKVIAPYFDQQAIARLQQWFNEKLQAPLPSLDFEVFGNLEMDMQTEPIMELGRLICGILEGQATLSFVLTDQEGRTLTTKIHKVEFGF